MSDRITFDSTVYCNQCQWCRIGRVNLCDNRQVLGVSIPAFRRDGCLAEYVVMPWWITYKLPDAVSFEEAALVEPAGSSGPLLVTMPSLCPCTAAWPHTVAAP